MFDTCGSTFATRGHDLEKGFDGSDGTGDGSPTYDWPAALVLQFYSQIFCLHTPNLLAWIQIPSAIALCDVIHHLSFQAQRVMKTLNKRSRAPRVSEVYPD